MWGEYVSTGLQGQSLTLGRKVSLGTPKHESQVQVSGLTQVCPKERACVLCSRKRLGGEHLWSLPGVDTQKLSAAKKVFVCHTGCQHDNNTDNAQWIQYLLCFHQEI